MLKIRILLICLTILIVSLGAIAASYYARGYRFDFVHFKFAPNGILVIKSDPANSQIYVNADYKALTGSAISLSPGTYDISVRKEGFSPWQKRMTIEKEIVTEANVSLFKIVPSISPVTFDGVTNPKISADFTKIAYAVLPTQADNNEKAGLWILETVSLPFGFAKEPKRITDGNMLGADWQFSPSGREILLTIGESVFRLDTTSFTPQGSRTNLASKKQSILASWQEEKNTKIKGQLQTLPEDLADILSRKTSNIAFSPDETKILYTASASATIVSGLVKPLPGSSTQKQERNIVKGRTYVYDTKEDRNFLLDPGESLLQIGNENIPNANRRLMWFPTSDHLVLAEEGKISMMDYDGTNKEVVYSGAYLAPHAYAFASTQKLLILTNLGADSSISNLYALNLK